MDQRQSEAEKLLKKKLIATIMVLVFLSGCLPTSIIDRILIIEAESYDYIGQNKVYGTVVFQNNLSNGGTSGGGTPPMTTTMRSVSGMTYDGKSLVDRFQQASQRPARVGKLRIMLCDRKMAEHGLEKTLENRLRDADTGGDMYLAVTDGDANQMLTGSYQTQLPISDYLTNLIDQSEEQNYPSSSLHSILYSYFGSYMDPFMPMIKKRGKHLEMDGIALFKKGKMAMSVPEDDAYIFKMLYEPFNQGFFDYQYSSDQHIALRNIGTGHQYSVKKGNSFRPEIYATVQIQAQVRQVAPGLLKEGPNKALEHKIEQDLEKRACAMVRRFQEKGIDPLGLGDLTRSYTRYFHGKSWPDRYKNAQFHCHVSLTITQNGISM